MEKKKTKRGFISLSSKDVGCLIDLTSHKPVHFPEFWKLKNKSEDKQGKGKDPA